MRTFALFIFSMLYMLNASACLELGDVQECVTYNTHTGTYTVDQYGCVPSSRDSGSSISNDSAASRDRFKDRSKDKSESKKKDKKKSKHRKKNR